MSRSIHLLSAVEVRDARCPSDREMVHLNDGGGLFLRARPNGSKSWVYRRGGRAMKLGEFPTMSLAEARREAAQLRPAKRGGINPIEMAREQAQAAKELHNAEIRRRKAEMTGGELFDQFAAIYAPAHWTPATLDNIRLRWNAHAGPLAALKLNEIDPQHLIRQCDKLLAAGKHDSANRLHKMARQVFRWGAKRGLIERNPFAELDDLPAPVPRERQRALSFEELTELLNVRLPASNLSVYAKAALRLILATGCRPGEILGARWNWIDRRAGLLRLPAEATKNRVGHNVPLSSFALKALDELADARQNGWLVPAGRGTAALTPNSFAKMVADRQRANEKAVIKGRTKAEHRLFELPDGPWRPHDLRRTTASRLRELNVAPSTIEDVLNHRPPKLMRTYQVGDQLPSRRSALELLGGFLERCESGLPVLRVVHEYRPREATQESI